MGYDAIFYLQVEEIEDFERVQNKAVNAYNELKKRDWFPMINYTYHTGSKGYGVGYNEYLLPEFFSFTRLFPNFNFYLIHIYFDNTNITIYKIKNDTVIFKKYWDFETYNLLPNINVCLNISSIDDDISYLFENDDN